MSVPVVLGIDIPHSTANTDDDNKRFNDTSACLFLEKIEGCTLRSFLTIKGSDKVTTTAKVNISANGEGEPAAKRPKLNSNVDSNADNNADSNTTTSPHTRLDEYAKRVAHATGIAIGKMHNINIIHGDLTTSNILLRNPKDAPPPLTLISTSDTKNNHDDNTKKNDISLWKPDIVMIDFGLSSTSVNTSSKKKSSSSSSHEERAVDLYVLERAFVTTHVGGEMLVDELLRGYKSSCKCSDSVFQRLSQVRLRGRKRECFG